MGEIADKTGQINYDENGHALTQGSTEMVISALYKTGKARMVERFDLRIPLAEVRLSEQGRLNRKIEDYGQLPASDFVLVGALTELNYNIVSEGAQLFIKGIGGGARTVVINVALDLRVINSRNFSVPYVTSLQKQIYGFEVEANIFRFFGDTLVEFDAGRIQNEPLQLGVRSVVEMAVYQIMTDFLGLPATDGCDLVKTDFMGEHLKRFES
ncbi:MAG: CsgG/HfaB family protein [Kiloniellales bacterium]